MLFVSYVHDEFVKYREYLEFYDQTVVGFYSELISSATNRITDGGVIVISHMPNTLREGLSGSTQSILYSEPVGNAPVYEQISDIILKSFNKDMSDGVASLYITKYDFDYKSELGQEALKRAKMLMFTGAYYDEESTKQDLDPLIDTFLAVNFDANKAIVLCGFDEDVSKETKDWFSSRFPEMEVDDEEKFCERLDEFLEQYDL